MRGNSLRGFQQVVSELFGFLTGSFFRVEQINLETI